MTNQTQQTQPSNQTSDIERIRSGETVTDGLLNDLRAKVGTMPKSERQALSAAIEEYAQKQQSALAQNVEQDEAVRALRQKLAESDSAESTIGDRVGGIVDAGLTTARDLGDKASEALEPVIDKAQELGTKAGEITSTTASRAQALAYDEWAKLKNPGQTVSAVVLQASGLLFLGYGIYRVAQWVKGKSESGWMGRILRFTGAATLAGAAVYLLGGRTAEAASPSSGMQPNSSHAQETDDDKDTDEQDKNEDGDSPAAVTPARDGSQQTPVTEDPKKKASAPAEAPLPPPTEVAPKAREQQKQQTPKSILESIPEGVNLVDGKAATVLVDGKNHSIQFKKDGFYLDGVQYAFIIEDAIGWKDVTVSFIEVRRAGPTLMMTMGALGKEGSFPANEAQLLKIIRSLMRGETIREELPKEKAGDKPKFALIQRA